MKKTVLILSVFILSAFNLVDNQDVKETLVSGKWFIESIQEKGKEPEMASDKEDEWLFFYPDGKMEESHFGELVTGEWKYFKKDNVIKIFESDAIKVKKILEVTNDKLVVEFFEDINAKDESLIITYVK